MRVATASLFFVQTLFLSVFISYPALSERACVKNASGKVVCGELVPKRNFDTKPPSLTPKKVFKTQSGLHFILNGCSKSRAGLICSIGIYNSTDFDKVVSYGNYYADSIIDSEGNTYNATVASSIGNGSVNPTTLPPKLTIRSQLVFKPNGPLTDYVRILRFTPGIDNRNFTVTFRDFKID